MTGWEAGKTKSRKTNLKPLAVVQVGSFRGLEQGNGRDEKQWTNLRYFGEDVT